MRDDNNDKDHTSRTPWIAVEVGNSFEVVNFNVVELIETKILLCCDYCDRHVEAIKQRQRIV